MPHFVVECSQPVLDVVSPEALMQALNETAVASGLFALEGPGGIKVRIRPYQHYLTVGQQQDFVHVFGNIMSGRTTEQKGALSKAMVTRLKAMLPKVPIVSMNVQEFDRETYCNRSMV